MPLRAMAWRSDRSVIRGEIDNRACGRVAGRVWFAWPTGRWNAILPAIAWCDLAGRRLEFAELVAMRSRHITWDMMEAEEEVL